MKCKKYRVVGQWESICFPDFVLEVNTWIKEGWTPQGGVMAFEDRSGKVRMFQAMVKEED